MKLLIYIIQEWKNSYTRKLAEFQNFSRRKENEVSEMKKYAFELLKPEFGSTVQPGDILVAGTNREGRNPLWHGEIATMNDFYALF